MAANDKTAIVLPYKERFASEGMGAICSVVRDLGLVGNAVDHLLVVGSAVDHPFRDMPFLPVHWRPVWWRRKSARYVDAVIEALRDQVVSAIEVHNRPQYIPALRRHFPDKKLSLYLHNDISLFPGFRRPSARKRVFSKLDQVICVSRHIADRATVGLEPSFRDKMCVVINGVDTTLFKPAAKRNTIVFGGRLIPEKGAHVLLDALATVLPRHPEWSALIVGAVRFEQSQKPTAYEQRIARGLERLGTQARAMGYIPRAQFRQSLSEAAITVIPSIWDDPCPLLAVESLASGCCVVGTPRGGLPEIIGEAGVIVPEDQAAVLAETLDSLIRDAPRRERLQQVARAHAVAVLDSRFSAKQLASLRLVVS